jgi:hypothetical protein
MMTSPHWSCGFCRKQARAFPQDFTPHGRQPQSQNFQPRRDSLIIAA